MAPFVILCHLFYALWAIDAVCTVSIRLRGRFHDAILRTIRTSQSRMTEKVDRVQFERSYPTWSSPARLWLIIAVRQSRGSCEGTCETVIQPEKGLDTSLPWACQVYK